MAGTEQQLAPLYRRLPHGPSGMAREEVESNQRSRLYGAMIEAVSRNGYERTTVAARDRAGGRLPTRLLRTVRQQGRVLPRDLRRDGRPGPTAPPAGLALRAAAGRTACTPPARASSAASRARRRARGWCSSTRWASDRGRANGCSSPASIFERIVATAFSLAPEKACYPQLTSRRRRDRRAQRRLQPAARAAPPRARGALRRKCWTGSSPTACRRAPAYGRSRWPARPTCRPPPPPS